MMRLSDERTIAAMRVGVEVTSDYALDHRGLVRRITAIRHVGKKMCSSGVRVSMSGGDECPTCGVPRAGPIIEVDASWAIPVAAPRVSRKSRKTAAAPKRAAKKRKP